MKVKRTTRKWLWISGLWVLALAGIATSFADDRSNHDDSVIVFAKIRIQPLD
jgi:hypothetical protein